MLTGVLACETLLVGAPHKQGGRTMPERVYLRLDEAVFRTLVAGGEVVLTTPTVEAHIILADIGFVQMRRAISDAVEARLRGERP
jgi:hypothetical protein